MRSPAAPKSTTRSNSSKTQPRTKRRRPRRRRVGPRPQPATAPYAPPNLSPQSYADPQDLQFSTAAARKEEIVDDLLAQGVPPADMEQKEEELRETGALHEPPAGNKAKLAKNG